MIAMKKRSSKKKCFSEIGKVRADHTTFYEGRFGVIFLKRNVL